jgi:hypothetical protein
MCSAGVWCGAHFCLQVLLVGPLVQTAAEDASARHGCQKWLLGESSGAGEAARGALQCGDCEQAG